MNERENPVNNIIYAHEHLTIDLSGHKNNPDCHLDDRFAALEDLRVLPELGVFRVIDQTNRGMGRDPVYAQSLADEAGIKLLHATGWYKEPFLPEEFYRYSEKQLCDIMISELRDGIAGTGLCASFIGEVGTGEDVVSPAEEKLLRASARAHAETGAPICTHTSMGRLGLEHIGIFREFSVALEKVVLSHIDLSGDMEYMLRLLDTGANIAFDTVGKLSYQPDTLRAQWLVELCSRGYGGQIVLSMDITRKSHYKANGGPGYAYMLDTFLPMLREAGCGKHELEAMLTHNPARIYGLEI